MLKSFSFLVAQAACLLTAAAQIPAFPGAEGFGAYSNGGRGGDVYVVTNLNASGTGSFADAVATVPSAGRTIVFAVSGYVRFPSGSSGFRLTKPKLTIAGQTAPGDGIGFYNNYFRVSGSDVVMRHIRLRHGKGGSGGDCLNLDSGANRSMLDHIAMQFSTDENMSSYNSAPEGITLQNSINAWGLQSHSAGGLWDMNYATSIGNLFAHNHTRNPKARPVGLLDWFNNVTYDWNIGFIMGDSATPIDWKSNVIGNYFLCPPGNLRSRALEKANLDRNGKPNFTLHVANNLFDKNGNTTLDGSDYGYGIASGSYTTSANRMSASGGTTISPVAPRLAFKKVVSSAGPLRLNALSGVPLRDEVDTHLFDNVLNFRRNIIARESDLPVSNSGFGTLNSAAAPLDTDKDGMPDNYESALGWNSTTKDHNTALPSSGGIITGTTFFPANTPAGYTRLEEYLHFLASPHTLVARNTASELSSVTVDLSRYTLGFNSLAPIFTLANIVGGAATQSGAGGRLVTFTPTLNLVGRARFEFTVTDSQGDSWTRSFLAVVASSGLPRSLVWKGGVSSNAWNTSTLNWTRNDGTTVAFASGDNALFDDRGSATPAINLPANVSAGPMTFDTTKDYTLSGSGSLFIGGPLTKRGPGSLTLSNGANTFGSIIHEAGTLALTKASVAGSTAIELEGGVLVLAPEHNSNLANPLEFNASTVVNVNAQHTSTGNWTGTSDATLNTTTMWTIAGTWSGFSGRIILGPSASIRLNGNNDTNFGSSSLAIDLGTGSGLFRNRNGNSMAYAIGTLTGGPNTSIEGAQTGTGTSTYSIGARGENATFHGSLKNGNPGGITHITKTGAGEWTLTGDSTHTGNTTISSGGIRLNGSSASSPIIVNSNTSLSGSGNSGGLVTVNSGGRLSPGASENAAGIFTAANGLTLNSGSNLAFDLGPTPAASSERVTVLSGTTALSGNIAFHINFLDFDQGVSAGTYPLIHGASTLTASGVTMTPVIPAPSGTTRQTYSLVRPASGTSPGFVNLMVTGNPASLVWSGADGGVWDLNSTSGNFTGGPTSTFFNLDRVTFDDTAPGGLANLSGSLHPSLVTIDNAAKNLTLGGSGVLAGAMKLVKNGSGTLTFANPLHFSGSSAIASPGNATLLSTSTAMTSLGNAHVDLSGVSAILTLNGSMSDFSGSLDFGTGSGTLRLNGNQNANSGSATTYFNLGFASATLSNRNGDRTFELGALSGGPDTRLRGRQTGTGETESIYRIGALGMSTVFAGTISHGGDLSGLGIVKTGSGNLTLSGSSDFIGGIAVESGSMTVSGETLASGEIGVESDAVLILQAGAVGGQVALINGTVSGHGTLHADLNVASGVVTGRGHATGTPGILSVASNTYFDSAASLQLLGGIQSDRLQVGGDLALAGTIHIQLSPGTGFGRHPLITYGGELEMGEITLSGIPAGTTAHLSATVAGSIDLIIDDSDEDGLPDSWEIQLFGTLAYGPGDDPDGDGQDNATEHLAGTDPADGASRFAATIESWDASEFTLAWPSVPERLYRIQTSTTLSGSWDLLGVIPGAPLPATRTTHILPRDGDRFYRVGTQP